MVRGADPAVAAKRRIRTETLAARAMRTDAELDAAAAAISRHGIEQWGGASVVAAYLSTGTEPPTRKLLEAFASSGTRVVVPVVDGDDLDWVVYVPGSDVSVSALGIEEPTGPRLGAAALSSAEVVLVPAIAVDTSGTRLGRGGGYYDRALAAITSPTVAVVFDEELFEIVPAEPHDRRVQGALRPSGYASF